MRQVLIIAIVALFALGTASAHKPAAKSKTELAQIACIFGEAILFIGDTTYRHDPEVPLLVCEKMPKFNLAPQDTSLSENEQNDKSHANFKKWIETHLTLPQRTMYYRFDISFIIERDGSVNNAHIFNSYEIALIDKEVIKVVLKSPKWSVGYNKGETTRTIMKIPLKFNFFFYEKRNSTIYFGAMHASGGTRRYKDRPINI